MECSTAKLGFIKINKRSKWLTGVYSQAKGAMQAIDFKNKELVDFKPGQTVFIMKSDLFN